MIIVLTYTKDQTAEAENLLDFIFFLHGRKKAYGILLVAANDCHEEFRTKIRLAAEVAFLEVDSIIADAANLFGAAVERMDGYKDIWLHIDPYCVPLVPRWLQAIEDHYEAQPKKIMGPHLKNDQGTWLDFHAVFPPDLARFPKENHTSISTKTRIIQLGKYDKREDVRDKSESDPAYLFCGDKSGELIKAIREERKK